MGLALSASTFVSRPPRWECDVDVIIDDGCSELSGRIANISESGFMAECERRLPLGEIVTVIIPGRGRVRAEVCWAVGWRLGARILDEADVPA